MHDPGEEIREFGVDLQKLTEDQIEEISKKSKIFIWLSVILFFLLPPLAGTLFLKMTLKTTSFEDMSTWQGFFYLGSYAGFYFLGYKLYKMTGRFLVSSMVRDARLKNLEDKLEGKDKK